MCALALHHRATNKCELSKATIGILQTESIIIIIEGCSSCSSSSTSMNLWFWLQKRICIISAFNFRTKKTLPHERSEKHTLFLSLIVEIRQHRENPQIAERKPFNVRERECYTHQENHQKMSTNSFSPSLCLCMYVIESHGICLCVAWMMTLIPNVSVLMHVEMKLGPKLTKNSFACTFPANSFHAIPHLLITTEIINVEICSDATEISYVCVRTSCRHSTSVFVSVVCCQIFAKFISPKRWSNGNRKYTLSSLSMPWRCRFSWKWSALPSKPRNHLTTTFQMRTKASITTQRISIGGNYVPVLLLLLRMFSFVSSNFVPFNFRYQSHWNVHSNVVCIIKCRYFFPIIIFVVVWFDVGA